jgi:hypothetical protein
MGAFGGPNIVEDGLVFAADAGNDQCYTSGSSTATDLIFGQTLTLENGSGTVIQPYDNSWGFDGTDDYIDSGNPSSLHLTGAISVGMWVNFTGASKCAISKEGYAGSGVRGWALWASYYGGNNPQFAIWNGSTAYSNGTSATRVDDGNWHHIVGVYEPSTAVRMYVDGSLSEENTTSIPASMNNLSDNMILGRFTLSYGAGYNFPGKAGGIKIYNRALTSSEIKQNYNVTKGRFGY